MPDVRKHLTRLCIATGLIMPPFLLGGVYSHVGTNLVIIGVISFFGIVCATSFLMHGEDLNISIAVVPLILIGLYILLQLIPLPPALLGLLSPKAAYFHNIEGSGSHPLTLSIPDSWYTLIRVMTLITFASLISRTLFADIKKWRRMLLNLVIAVSTCMIAVSIVFRMLQFDTWLYGTLRHPGFLIDPLIINPNHAAGFFGISGILSLLLLTKKEHKRKKMFYGTLFFLHSLAVFGTLSRGGILSYVISIIFFMVISRYSFVRSRKNLIIFLFPLLLVLSTVFYAGNTLLKEEFNYEKDGFFDKVANYKNVADYAADFFITGSGSGSFSKVYTYYQKNPETRFVQLENEPVQFFLEYGLFAFLIFGLLIFIVLKQKNKDRRYKGYYSVFLFVILQNTVDFNLHNFSTLFPVTIIMILSTDRIKLTGLRSKGYALLFLFLCILTFGISVTRTGHRLVGYEKETDYKKSVYLYPAHYLVPMEKTIQRMNSEKLTEAIEASQTVSAVIEKAPNYYFSYYLAGSLMLRIGSYDQAIDFFKLSLERTDDNILNVFKRINGSLKNYKLEKRIPEIIPRSHERLEKIENYLVNESAQNRVLENHILKNTETFPFASVRILFRKKDLPEAEEILSQIRKEDLNEHNLGEFFILSGKMAQYEKKYSEAFEMFLKGAEITHSFSHYMLAAYCALHLGKKEVKLIEHHLEKNSLHSTNNLAEFYLWKHKLETMNKDFSMALKSLEKAARLSSRPHIKKRLALFYYKNGLFSEAEREIKNIIRDHPDYQKKEMKHLQKTIRNSIIKKDQDIIKDSLLGN